MVLKEISVPLWDQADCSAALEAQFGSGYSLPGGSCLISPQDFCSPIIFIIFSFLQTPRSVPGPRAGTPVMVTGAGLWSVNRTASGIRCVQTFRSRFRQNRVFPNRPAQLMNLDELCKESVGHINIKSALNQCPCSLLSIRSDDFNVPHFRLALSALASGVGGKACRACTPGYRASTPGWRGQSSGASGGSSDTVIRNDKK